MKSSKHATSEHDILHDAIIYILFYPVGELGELQKKLTDTEYDLKTARYAMKTTHQISFSRYSIKYMVAKTLCITFTDRETIAVRDRTVAARDTNISELQRTSDAITDRLKVRITFNNNGTVNN